MTCFGASFNVKNSTNFFQVLVSFVHWDFSVKIKVCFSSYQENDCFFMGILSSFFDPAFKTVEAFLAVNTEGKKYSTDSLIERPHDGSEGFLTGLV